MIRTQFLQQYLKIKEQKTIMGFKKENTLIILPHISYIEAFFSLSLPRFLLSSGYFKAGFLEFLSNLHEDGLGVPVAFTVGHLCRV